MTFVIDTEVTSQEDIEYLSKFKHFKEPKYVKMHGLSNSIKISDGVCEIKIQDTKVLTEILKQLGDL